MAYAASGPPPSRSRRYPAKRPKYNEPPPLPVTAAEAQAFLDAWIQDGKVSLPEARKEPTRRDMEHPDYCIYHRMVHHPTKDCWGLQTLFEKFMVEEAVELTATKDVLRKPLPNHKDNGKAVMMVEVSEVPTKIEILKRSVPCSVAEIFPEEAIEDWRTPISNELKSPSAAITLSNLKHFTIYQGVLYYRGSGGLLARCIGEEEAKIKVQEVHEQSCGTGDISLYRRLQRQGPRQFAEGDLVLKAAPHVMKGKSPSKFAVKWEGPFVVKEANENGYYRLSGPDSEVLLAPINAKWLKAYHP
ncbi:hypothetical protein RHMOL_Rhmol09G0041700 [Rhododendron molle]|uniref:Uncharacterized protein n=1 Tax=Rhododendron molle TaxID=49168 RepID=A0ACC0M9G3_RHOML|nr:hypothetical protein RHMOL_Rhmol09G0041700 [Rhododendron molle]